MATRSTSLGIFAILLGGVAIGSAAIFMRLSPVAPPAAAFWRMAISVPIFLGLLAIVPALRPTTAAFDSKSLKLAFWVGFWFAIDLFFWHWSVAYTTVANATLLANLASVFTVVAGFLLFRETFSRKFLAGLALAFAGAIVLIGQNAAFNPDYLLGDFLGIVTALALTGYMITAAKARANLGAMYLMAASAFVTAALLLPPALLAEGAFMPESLAGWLPLIGLGIVTQVIGQGLIVYGLAHISAAHGAIGLLVQPIVAAILAWIIFGEALGPVHLAGGIMILAGIGISQRSR